MLIFDKREFIATIMKNGTRILRNTLAREMRKKNAKHVWLLEKKLTEMQTDVVPRKSMRIVKSAAGRLARTQGMTERNVAPKKYTVRPKSAVQLRVKMRRDLRTTVASLNQPSTQLASV